jgi:hypothetical protein
MRLSLPTDRITWQAAGLALAGAVVAAWSAGFFVGLIVRFAFGS